jgi:hypothetical protein
MVHLMPCRNPYRFYIHFAFTYILRWSLKLSVKRTWTSSAFSTMRVLEVSWPRLLSLVCKVALNRIFSVTNSTILIVHRGIVSPTLNVKPTLLVIPCIILWGIIDLQCYNYSHLLSDFLHPCFKTSHDNIS